MSTPVGAGTRRGRQWWTAERRQRAGRDQGSEGEQPLAWGGTPPICAPGDHWPWGAWEAGVSVSCNTRIPPVLQGQLWDVVGTRERSSAALARVGARYGALWGALGGGARKELQTGK